MRVSKIIAIILAAIILTSCSGKNNQNEDEQNNAVEDVLNEVDEQDKANQDETAPTEEDTLVTEEDDNEQSSEPDENVESYVNYLKENLKLGLSEEEVLELVQYPFHRVLSGMDGNMMWRFDILTQETYEFSNPNNLDTLDIDGLLAEKVKIVLYVSWTEEKTVKSYTIYYIHPEENSIIEYRIFSDGTVKESVI